MDRLKVENVRAGQRLFVVPLRANVAAGTKPGVIPQRGQYLRADDYLIGLMRRNVVAVYLQEPPAPVKPEPQPEPLNPEPEDE